MSGKIIVCRCEDCTLEDIQHAVAKGYSDIEEVKRYTGFGTGPCQGKECLRAVALGAMHVELGDAGIVIAGGQESMSLSPHVAHLRAGTKMGDMSFIDSMIKDGLWDAFNGYHMGQTAENVANRSPWPDAVQR